MYASMLLPLVLFLTYMHLEYNTLLLVSLYSKQWCTRSKWKSDETSEGTRRTLAQESSLGAYSSFQLPGIKDRAKFGESSENGTN